MFHNIKSDLQHCHLTETAGHFLSQSVYFSRTKVSGQGKAMFVSFMFDTFTAYGLILDM